MPLTADHWAELVEPLANRGFWELGYGGSGRRQSMLPTLFDMRGSQFASEKSQPIGGLSDDGWNFEDTGRVQYGEPVKGYEATFTHKQFARGVTIERELIDDSRWSAIENQTRTLGDAAFRFREKAGAQIFENAFSAATTSTLDKYGIDAVGPDGVALCSDAHPAHSGDASTTQTNEGTLALTEANVSTTRTEMMAFQDMQGELLAVMPDEIIVPPELEDDALKILKSTQEPGSANNAINPQQGRFRVIVWHYLTDSNNWFMCDSGLRAQYLAWYDRIALEFGRESDFDTFMAKYRAYMRFSVGWVDWRFIYGHAVA